jgi:hypothetical protein
MAEARYAKSPETGTAESEKRTEKSNGFHLFFSFAASRLRGQSPDSG